MESGSASSATDNRNTEMEQAVSQLVRHAAQTNHIHLDPAIKRVDTSQDALQTELQRLVSEMDAITTVLESVTLDPETSARMEETRECLRRTNRKLTTIRGRLGRLRVFEENDRLQLTTRELQEVVRITPDIKNQLPQGEDSKTTADSAEIEEEKDIYNAVTSNAIDETPEEVFPGNQDTEEDSSVASELWGERHSSNPGDESSSDMWQEKSDTQPEQPS